jgi:para-nitrobenzyl esterase
MRKNKVFILILTLFAVSLLLGTGCWFIDSELVRSTEYGKVEGIYNEETDTYAWLGVPYAKPPVGDLRWRAPQDPDPWDGIRDATKQCSECTQLYTTSKWIRMSWAIGDEDCLYLDIYSPKTRKKDLPVYVWIHGGSNNFGSAKQYNGSVLASRSNVVVVVVQYRLGPLGWLTHPALRKGDPLDDSGNFGTLDHIQALKWIRNNIRAFGGDPRNVLITGESAGAHNVMNLVISPLAKGLFHKAMSESGGMVTRPVAYGEVQAEATIAALLAADELSGIPDMDLDGDVDDNDTELYLRSKSSYEIFEAYYASYFSLPTYDAYQDGVVIPGSVVSTIRSGNYNKVPIILGANEYETKAFMPLYGKAVKEGLSFFYPGFPTVPSTSYTWFDLIGVLDGDIPLLSDVLPLQTDKDVYEICGYYGSRNWRAKFVDERARALKEQQNKVWAYYFKWGGPGSGPEPFDFIYGAGHAMEIAFFFGDDNHMWGYSYTPENENGRKALQYAMMRYLANFAKTGNPNGCGLQVWKKWSNKEGKPKVIVFDADLDKALISMSNEEVTFADVSAELFYVSSLLPTDVQALPWYFQWHSPEP